MTEIVKVAVALLFIKSVTSYSYSLASPTLPSLLPLREKTITDAAAMFSFTDM